MLQLYANSPVQVHSLDIFSEEMELLLETATAGAAWSCAVGTHLCGALSPRLVALYGAAGPTDPTAGAAGEGGA